MKNFNDSLLLALKASAEAAQPQAIEVSDGEVAVAAERLAATGYDFSRVGNSLNALRAYLEGKQIALKGFAGTGKTMFFKSLSASGVSRNRIVIYSLMEHGNDFESVIVDDIKSYNDCELVVDDIGLESTWNGKRSDDILTRIIAVREQSPYRTHCTTNLSAAQIKARYDERVVSRLKCCTWFAMVGADNRRAVTNPAEAAFKAKCVDPESWAHCAERCSAYINGKCSLGKTIPPFLLDSTPESFCGVGTTIPYSA